MMNYMQCTAGVLLFVLMAAPALAGERNMYLALKAGGGDIRVNSEHAINAVTEEEDVFSGGIFAGYNFDSGWLIEAGYSGDFSEDIFDSYEVSQLMGMLGYTIRAGRDFTFAPKLGFSMWELSTFESGLFNFFGGDEERSYDGTDPVWSVEGEYSLNQLVQLNLSYTQGSYGFGDLDSLRFGVEFDF